MVDHDKASRIKRAIEEATGLHWWFSTASWGWYFPSGNNYIGLSNHELDLPVEEIIHLALSRAPFVLKTEELLW